MANNLYDKAREKFARAQINWETDSISAVLVDLGAYSFSQSHEFFSSVPVAARISSSVALTGKTAEGGACDANDVTFPSVTGVSIEAIIIYKVGGDEASSPLIGFFDSATGLPITPNSGDIILNWDNGVNRIFKL